MPLTPEQLDRLRRWVDERSYDAPSVRQEIARRLLASGELDSSGS